MRTRMTLLHPEFPPVMNKNTCTVVYNYKILDTSATTKCQMQVRIIYISTTPTPLAYSARRAIHRQNGQVTFRGLPKKPSRLDRRTSDKETYICLLSEVRLSSSRWAERAGIVLPTSSRERGCRHPNKGLADILQEVDSGGTQGPSARAFC